MADQNKPESIIFEIGVDGHPEEPVTASLFAFDSRGEMLAVGVLTEGVATLAVSPDQLRRARLLVAPVSPGRGDAPPTLDMLERLNPYEPTWKFSPDRLAYRLLPVPEFHWRHWYWCSCRVRGKVIKVESSGGVTYENPVCHARVHVCEVDRIPWVIERLPDDILLRVRDELLWAIEHPAPIRDLCEKPFPVDPGNIDPVPVTVRASELLLSADATRETINLQPLPVNRYPLQLESHAALYADSIGIVRRALIDHVSLIRIFWCDWDWLWPWFRSNCDELTVVETDQNGRFDTTIWYPCFGDRPDLYFWVEYSIGETWTTVYNPSIRCNTYWDYACGTDVTIRVTDPRVRGCRDRPELLGMKLVVKTIGRQVSMGEIYPDQTDPKAGQVKEGWQHAVKPSPFGGVLEPRVDFGSGLKGAGITHYRWSYRHLASTNDNDWRVIDAPILRHYRETSLPLSPVIYKSEKIAPAPGITGYYALIDPILPVNGEEWEVLDESFDLASAYFDTTTLVENDAAGNKYELKLELFRNVAGSAVRVDLGVEGIELYEIADPAPLVAGTYSTTLASGDRVLRNAGSVVGYRFIAHLDNRLCSGSIQDVTVNGVAAGPCGFLEYNLPTDAVDIGFIATHPDYFAYFEFGVVRVSTAIKELSASGLVESASVQDNLPSAVPFTRTVSTFSKQSSVALLMSSGLAVSETQCNRAAFAASLVVRALATDGYVRLSNLDSGNKLKAFAITKA